MKRALSLLSVFILLFSLTACKADHTLNAIDSGSFQATDGVMNYTGVLTSDGDTMKITLSSPESVAGICCEFRGEELHTTLNGLDCITAADSLPPNAVPALIREVFTQTDKASYESTEDGVDSYTLPTRNGTADIRAQDGMIRSVTAGGVTVVIKESTAASVG